MAEPQVTVAEMVESVRDNLDEATASKWTDPMLIRFLSRAKDAVWAEVRKLKRGYFEVTRTSLDGTLTIRGESYAASGFAIAASTATYTLPPDFVEMTEIRCLTSGYEYVPFIYKPETDPVWQGMRRNDGTTTTSDPTGFFYTLRGERTLVITPLSNRALNLSITYVRMLDKFTATTLAAATETLEMPHPLYMCVEECATWRAKLRDNDAGAGAWSQVAQASVQRFLGSHARQNTDPEFVPDTW